MLSFINIDAIISDPWLLTASVLLVTGPLLFLFALIKFFMTPKAPDAAFPFAMESPVPPNAGDATKHKMAPYIEPVEETPAHTPSPVMRAHRPATPDMEKTVVLPPGVADVQAQLEIALTQIKTINKKIHELEGEVTKMGRLAQVKLDIPEWKEPPSNAAEFAQKLLKLAEHVIVLEKDVARMKIESPVPPPPQAPSQASAPTPAQATQRPPIMPL